MAQFFYNFNDMAAGIQPTGWAETWGTANSDFTTVDLGGGDIAVRNSISGQADHLLACTDAGSVTNAEIVAKFRTNQTGNYENTIFVRSSATDASKTGYYLALNNASGTLYVNLEQWFNNTYYPWHAHNYSWGANVWYWFRYNVNGNVHSIKWWQDGSAEPGSWSAQYTDATGTAYNGAGYIAIAGYTAGGARDWDRIGIGTNGDPAPTSMVTTKTQTGKGRVTATTTKTQTGKSRITIVTQRTQTGIASVKNTITRNQTGRAYIGTPITRDQTGKSSILKSVPRTQAGTSRVQISTTRNLLGVSRITRVTSRAQTGVSNLIKLTSRDQTGKASVRQSVVRDQQGRTAILGGAQRTITGKSRIIERFGLDRPQAVAERNILRAGDGRHDRPKGIK